MNQQVTLVRPKAWPLPQRAEVFAKSLSPALELAREVGASLPGTALAQGLLKRVLEID